MEASGKRIEEDRKAISGEVKSIEEERAGIDQIQDFNTKNAAIDKFNARIAASTARVSKFNQSLVEQSKASELKLKDYNKRAEELRKRQDAFNEEIKAGKSEQDKLDATRNLPKMAPIQGQTSIDKGAFANRYITETEKRKAALPGPMGIPSVDYSGTTPTIGEKKYKEKSADAQIIEDFNPADPSASTQKIVVRDSNTLNKVLKENTGLDVYMSSDTGQKPKNALTNGFDPRGLNPNELQDFIARGKGYEAHTANTLNSEQKELADAVIRGSITPEKAKEMSDVLFQNTLKRISEGPRSPQNMRQLFRNGEVTYRTALDSLREQGIGVSESYQPRVELPKKIDEGILGAGQANWVNLGSPAEVRKLVTEAQGKLQDVTTMANPAVDPQEYLRDALEAKSYQVQMEKAATELSRERGITYAQAEDLIFKDRTAWEKTKGFFAQVPIGVAKLGTDLAQAFSWIWNEATDTAEAFGAVVRMSGGEQVEGKGQDQLSVTPGTEINLRQKLYNSMEQVNQDISKALEDPRITEGVRDRGFAEELTGGIVSTFAYMGAAKLGASAFRLAGMSARTGGIAGGTLLVGAPAQGGEAYRFAKDYGLSDKDAFGAVMQGAILSLSEYIPFAQSVEKLNPLIRGAGYRAGLRVALQAVEEGGQETYQSSSSSGINIQTAVSKYSAEALSQNPEVRQNAEQKLQLLAQESDATWDRALRGGLIGALSGGLFQGVQELSGGGRRAIRASRIESDMTRIRMVNADVLNGTPSAGIPNVPQGSTQGQAQAIESLHAQKSAETISKVVGEEVTPKQASDINNMAGPNERIVQAQAKALEKVEQELLTKAAVEKEKMQSGTIEESAEASVRHEEILTQARDVLQQRVDLLSGASQTVKARHEASVELQGLESDPATAGVARVARVALKVASGRTDLLSEEERQLARTARANGVPAFVEENGRFRLTAEGLARLQERAPKTSQFIQVREAKPAQAKEQAKVGQAPQPKKTASGKLVSPVGPKSKAGLQRKITQPPAAGSALRPLGTREVAIARVVGRAIKALIKIDLSEDTITRLASLVVKQNPDLSTSKITQAVTTFLATNGIKQAAPGMIAGKQPTQADKDAIIQQYLASGYSEAEATTWAEDIVGEFNESQNSIEASINETIQRLEQEETSRATPEVAARVQVAPAQLRQLTPAESQKFAAIKNTLRAFIGFEVDEDILNRLSEIMAKRSRGAISSIGIVTQFIRENNIPTIQSAVPTDAKALANYNRLVAQAQAAIREDLSGIEASQSNHPTEQAEAQDVTDARDLISSLATQYLGALQKTGSVIVEAQDSDTEAAESGLLFDRFKNEIVYNPKSLTGLTEEQIRLRFMEEMIHAIAWKLKLPYKTLAAQIRRSGKAEQVARFYATWITKESESASKADYDRILNDDFQLANEYLRMIVQLAIDGKTTELAEMEVRETRPWLQAILDFLQNALLRLPEDPLLQTYVNRIKEALLSLPNSTSVGIQGGRGYIETPTRAVFRSFDGATQIGVRYSVVDIKDARTNTQLNTSQNRDRTSRVSRQQVENIKANFTAGRIADGAVVYPDGFRRGNPITTEGTPILDSSLNVLVGNGRLQALTELQQDGNAKYAEYKSYITDPRVAEQFGFTPEQLQQISQMEAPVLVRVLEQDFQKTEQGIQDQEIFVRTSNVSTTATLSAVEQAVSDARAMIPPQDGADPLGRLGVNEDGTTQLSKSFIDWFITNVVSPTERPQIFTPDGQLAPVAEKRMRIAILARALAPSDLQDRSSLQALSDVVTGTWEGSQKVAKALESISQQVAIYRSLQEAGERYQLDISQDILTAIKMVSEFKADAEASNASREITEGPMLQRAKIWQRSRLAFASVNQTTTKLFEVFASSGSPQVSAASVRKPILAYYVMANAEGNPREDAELGTGLLATERTPARTMQEIFSIAFEVTQAPTEVTRSRTILSSKAIAEIAKRMRILREIRSERGLTGRQQQEYENLERTMGQQFMFDGEAMGRRPEQIMPPEVTARQPQQIDEKYVQERLFSRRMRRTDETNNFLPGLAEPSGQGTPSAQQNAQGDVTGQAGGIRPEQGAVGLGGVGSPAEVGAGGVGDGQPATTAEATGGAGVLGTYGGSAQATTGGIGTSGGGVNTGLRTTTNGQLGSGAGLGAGAGSGAAVGGGEVAGQVAGGQVRGGDTGATTSPSTGEQSRLGTGPVGTTAGGVGADEGGGRSGEGAIQPATAGYRATPTRGAFEYSIENGQLVRADGSGVKQAVPATEEQRRATEKYLPVRDSLKALFSAESLGDTEVASVARAKLNEVYSDFVRAYGTFNRANDPYYSGNAAIQFLADDPEFYSVLSIESPITATQRALFDDVATLRSFTWGRGSIFESARIAPNNPPTSAKTPSESVQNSLSWNGGSVTAEYVSQQTGLAVPQAREALVSDQTIVEEIDPDTATPTGRFVPVGHFVSGNVRQKLKTTKRALDNGHQVQRHISMLKTAIPAEQPLAKMYVGPSAQWIPDDIRNSFIYEALDFTGNAFLADRYYVEERSPAPAIGEFSIYGITSARMFEHLLNGTLPVVRINGTVNPRKTSEAVSVLKNLERKWNQWVRSGIHGQRVEGIFNSVLNAYAEPSYTFSPALPGLAVDVRRDMHQTSAVARSLLNRTSYIAHMVGAGKTFTQIMTAMELKRLGLAQKNLMVVYGPTFGQFMTSIKRAYPTARVLAATKTTFSPVNRQKFLEMAATQDWDIILMTHDQYDMLKPGEDSVRRFYGDQRRVLGSRRSNIPTDGGRAEGNLNRKMDRLDAKMANALDDLAKIPSHLKFDSLNVDSLFIDEAHTYKGIPIQTTRTGKGMPNRHSNIGDSNLLKTSSIHGKNGRVYLASGTPLVNSVAEAYGVIKLANPELLTDAGIETFDDFISSFVRPDWTLSYTWKGTFEFEERYERFYNEKQLAGLVRQVLDIRLNPVEINLKLPILKSGVPEIVAAAETPATEAINDTLRMISNKWDDLSADILRGSWANGKYMMDGAEVAPSSLRRVFGWVPIVSMQLGAASSLDPRLVDPTLTDSPISKVNTAVDRVAKIYRENKDGSILIFMDRYQPIKADTLARLRAFAEGRWDDAVPKDVEADESIDGEKDTNDVEEDKPSQPTFNLAREVIDKLASKGVKRNEIAWINDAVDVEELFQRVRSGEVRVIIGSTGRLGQGVDFAQRLVAMVEMDPPIQMVPSAAAQRRGRIIRQSNLNEEVEHIRMGLMDSMDVSIYQMLERKERSSTQFLSGGVSDMAGTPDPLAQDSPELLFGYMKAALVRDPRVIQLVEAMRDAKELRLEYEAHEEQRISTERRLRDFEEELNHTRERLTYQKDINDFLEKIPFARQDSTGTRSFNFTHFSGGSQYLQALAGSSRDIPATGEAIKGRDQFTSAIGRSMTSHQDKLRAMNTQQLQQANFEMSDEYTLNNRFLVTLKTTIGADGRTITGHKFTLSSFYPTNNGFKRADLRSAQVVNPGDVQARIVMWATDFNEVVVKSEADIRRMTEDMSVASGRLSNQFPMIEQMLIVERKLDALQQDIASNPPARDRGLRSRTIRRDMALKLIEGLKATSSDIPVSEDNELPINTPSYPVGSVPTSRIDMLGEFLKSDNVATTPEFKAFFGDSKVVGADGNPLVVAHGTRRADRVGNRFLKYRATSGPMPFFTDSLKLAASYSMSKADTSIEDNAYEKWFYLEMNGRRVPLTIAWNYMTTEQRNKMRELAPKVTLDDDMKAIVEEGNTRGNGGYDMSIRDANGNVLSALIDAWLNSGSVFGREGELFPSILKAAGLDEPLFYDSPELQLPAIYPVYLRIQNPLDTSEIPDSVYQALEATALRRTAKQKIRGLGDIWGKDSSTPKEWIQRLQNDRENKTTYAWTSIPDWVTDTLRGLGYDGIRDISGKNNPTVNSLIFQSHAVYIPFEPTQIKSVFNIGDFGEGSNILRSRKIRNNNAQDLIPMDEEANASDEARRYQGVDELRAERRQAYDGVPGPQARPDKSIPIVDIGFDPAADQKRIAEETRGILGPKEDLKKYASLSPEKIMEYIKKSTTKTSRNWLDIFLDLVGGKLDRLDHYAPGTATALLEERRSSALAATALTDLIDYMRRKVQAQFGYPKWWSLGPNKNRMKNAMAELLPVASRLEIDRMGDAGPIWKPFNQPAGVIAGDEMIRNGYQTGKTIIAKNGETLVIGDNLKDRYGKPTEFWRLYRPMSAQRQQEVLDAYATKYPEMVGVLMEWIMPGQISKITRRGIEIPTFNRYSLHSFYNMSPFGGTSSVPGYTPDVSATGFHLAAVLARLPFLGKLVSNLPMGGRVALRPFISGGRFTQTGVLREAGAVRNLFDGFSTRAMEIHKEIIRAKVRSQLLEASTIPSSKVDPELIGTDYIRVGAALRQMALAAAKMRAQVSDLSALDANQPELFDKAKFSKYVGQLIEDGQKFIDQDLVMRKEVYKELLDTLAEEKSEGIMARVTLGLFKRLNAGYLALPRVAAVNLLTNEGLKLMYAVNRLIYGTMLRPIVGARDGRVALREAWYVARELFGASSIFKSHRVMKSEIIPMEVFREQTLVAAIMMDKDATAIDEIVRLNLGGAFLKAIRYGDIDAAQKQQLAYASYQAHAEEAWTDATRENPALTQQSKNAWKIKWAQSQPATFHEMVQKTALTYLFDYNNVPSWLDGQNAGVAKKLLQASVFPFFKFLYNLARQVVTFVPYSAYKSNAINLPFKLIGYGVQKIGSEELGQKIGSVARAESTPQQRANAISNLLLMAGIFSLGAALGLGDDDEDPLIGSDVDEEGKQKDASQRAGGRANVSKLARIVLAFFRMKGTPLYQKFDSDEDAYLRLRNFPYIREAMIVGNISRIMRLRAMSVGSLDALSTETTEDDLKIEGPSSEGELRALIQRREAALSQELSSMLTDYATLGIMGKLVIGGVYGMSSPYDIGKTTSWKLGESLVDLVTSGVAPVAMRNFVRDMADPISRRNRPSAALGYAGGFVDSVKNITPFLSRTLPPQADVKTRTYDPLNPKQAIDMAGISDLGIEDSLKMFADEKGKLKVSYPDPFAVRKQDRELIALRGLLGLNFVKVKRKKEDKENP